MVLVQRIMAPVPSRKPGRYPRWGYLDKFEEQEYLARSMALMLLVAVAASLGLRLAPHRLTSADIVPARRPYSGSINPLPMPPPVAKQPPSPAVSPQRVRITEFRRHPVPVADAPLDRTLSTVDAVVGPETGPAGDATGLAGEGEFAVPGAESPVWPEFDEFIPVERLPELVAIQPPAYPDLAREAGAEGRVTVAVLVGADGVVVDARVLEGVLGLEEAAVASARTAVFKPALQQGKAVAVWVLIPIEFALRGR